MIKINFSSRLRFDNTKVMLIIKKPLPHLLFSIIGLLIFASIIMYNSFGIDSTGGNFINIFFAISSLHFLYLIGLKEESIIDLELKTVIRKKKMLNITFKKVNTSWQEPYYFKYVVNYDSYQNITAIWLVAASTANNKSHQVIQFFDKKSFIKFQELFNNQFPGNKILEWHD